MSSLQNFNNAMKYIEENLFLEIDFIKVSKIAACSEYHFKRMFSFLAGMPIGEYIRLRKLSKIVNILKDGETKIIDAAQISGYESADAFSKAFQKVHGISPNKVKKSKEPIKILLPMTFQLTIKGGIQMEYRLVEKDEFYIVGFEKRIKLIFNGVNSEMKNIYEKLTIEKIKFLKDLNNEEPKGIVSVSANFSDRTKEGSELDQYIGVAVKEKLENNGFDYLYVKPYTWAVFSVCGKFPEALQDTWSKIYSEWFPDSGYESVDAPEILWNESPDTTKLDYKSEIWIPVTKKLK